MQDAINRLTAMPTCNLCIAFCKNDKPKKQYSSRMKRVVSLLILVTLTVTLSMAQKTIAVQRNGEAAFYTEWAQAWSNTQAGDTLYLPGGTFIIGDLDIDKPVTIIGVGHDTASIHDRLYSNLNGNLRLITGSDGTHLHGFAVNNLNIGTSGTNDNVADLHISRCRIRGTCTLGATSPSPAQQIFIDESVLNSIQGQNARHVFFTKCIITGTVISFNQNVTFVNNIFTHNYYYLYQVTNTLFRNNIFRFGGYPSEPWVTTSHNNLLEYNIFVANLSIDPQTDLNTWENNFFNQPLESIFVQYLDEGFSSRNDYHLKTTSVGIGAGSDGFDIGIYGTAVPYKEGAVPFTPRIVEETFSKQTDSEGKINIHVKVEAQER